MTRFDNPSLSRRRFLASASAMGAAVSLTPRSLLRNALGPLDHAAMADGVVQQFRQAAASSPVEATRLRDNAWLLAGSGCNVIALLRDDGVTLVDSGIVGAKVAGAVKALSRHPITHLINTHWHFDHTDANAWVQAHGAAIIAHEQTRRHLAVDTRVEDWFHFTFPAAPAASLPTTVIGGQQVHDVRAAHARVQGYAPAHTDSDISVYLPGPDVLCAGDIWWNGLYPFIDYGTGGSISGMIRAADATVARAGADTIIVPGHGTAGRRIDLMTYRQMLATIRDRVASSKANGHTADEVVASKPTAAFDSRWGHGFIDPNFFTRLVYKGV